MTARCLDQARHFVFDLQQRGAIFTLRRDETFWCDLNGVATITCEAQAQAISEQVLELRDEIRHVLLADDRVIH